MSIKLRLQQPQFYDYSCTIFSTIDAVILGLCYIAPDRQAFTQLTPRDKLPAMPIPFDSDVLGEPRALFLIVGGAQILPTLIQKRG